MDIPVAMSNKPPSKVFETNTTHRALVKIYHDSVRLRNSSGRDGTSPQQFNRRLEDEVTLIRKRMKSGTYRLTEYKQVLKLKTADACPRELSVPTVRDRIAIKSMSITLKECFPDIEIGVPNAKITKALNLVESGKFDSYIRLDIRNFYPSIQIDQLMLMLKRRSRSRLILDFVLQVLSTETLPAGPRLHSAKNTPKGVPQGLSISNILAEIYLSDFDKNFEETSKFELVRYVDDILILCDSKDLGYAESMVTEELISLGLQVHRKDATSSKSSAGRVAEGFDFLGYFITLKRASVRKSSRLKIEQSIARTFTRFKYLRLRITEISDARNAAFAKLEWYLNLTIKGCIFQGSRRGWLQYYSEMDDLTLLKQLDLQVNKHCRSFGAEGQISISTFLSAYWAIRTSNLGRHSAENFDTYSLAQKRSTLKRIFDFDTTRLDNMTDDDIDRTFMKKVLKVAQELEQDVGQTS